MKLTATIFWRPWKGQSYGLVLTETAPDGIEYDFKIERVKRHERHMDLPVTTELLRDELLAFVASVFEQAAALGIQPTDLAAVVAAQNRHLEDMRRITHRLLNDRLDPPVLTRAPDRSS